MSDEWDVFITLNGVSWTLDVLVTEEQADEIAKMIVEKLPDADVKVVDCGA